MCKRDEVFELGLNEFAVWTTLLGNSVISDIAFAVDLKCERVTGRRLNQLCE